MKLAKYVMTLIFVVAITSFATEWTGANSVPATTKTIDGKKFYVISNADELAWIASQVNDGNNDINVFINNDILFGADIESTSTSDWVTIGSSEYQFNGIFEGNGFSIYGLSGESLFYHIGESGVVQNIKVKKSKLQLSSIAVFNRGNVKNCFNYSNVSIIGGFWSGGIVAHNYGLIENCHNYGNVSAYYKSYTTKAGGVVATNSGVIRKCSNEGLVSTTSYGRYPTYAGGLAAVNYHIISDGYNFGDVASYSEDSTCFTGGLVGYNFSDTANVVNSFSTAQNIDGCRYRYSTTYDRKGGIVGVDSNKAVVNNSYYDVSLSNTSKPFNSTTTGIIVNSSGKQTEVMQTPQFAWILNTTNGSQINSAIWSQYDGYPVFANDSLKPIYKITFDDGENTLNYYTNHNGLIPDFPEMPIAPEGKAFVGWIDADGKSCDINTVFAKDQIITASFLEWEDVLYTIQFFDANGNLLDKVTVHSGEVPVYSGATPTKVATTAYSYTFAGWSPAIGEAAWHTDYTAKFDSTLNQYKITYSDYDGTELYTNDYNYGVKPTYSTIPKRSSTDKYIYTFKGWNPTVATVVGAATYIAEYDSTLREYQITFKNGNTIIESSYAAYGTLPSLSGDEPTKAATKQWTYTFKGWNPEIEDVTGNETYSAVFDSSLNSYTIAFICGAATLQSSDVPYGSMPSYVGSEPKKESTEKYIYKFKTWTPTLAKVTDDASYTAVFDSTIRSYEITFVNGLITLQSGDMAYGSTPTYSGDKPLKPESEGYTYSFAGWNPVITNVKKEATYTAVFDSTAKKFVVVFMNGKDTLSTQSVEYGVIPKYTAKEPSMEQNDKVTYSFTGWDNELIAVTKDAVYNAVFDSSARKYLVTFMNGKDTLSTQLVEYGVIPKYTAKEPNKEKNDKVTYSFAGWDNDLVEVTKDVVYNAMFDSTEIQMLRNPAYRGSIAVASIGNKSLVIQNMVIGQKYYVMDMQGRIVNKGVANQSSTVVSVNSTGSYLIRIGNQIKTAVIK